MPRYLMSLKFRDNSTIVTTQTQDLKDDADAYLHAEKEFKNRIGLERVNIFRQVGAIETVTTLQRKDLSDGNPEDAVKAEGV